jgi:uncharacterized membrane protein YraQ (UPF0718 family)
MPDQASTVSQAFHDACLSFLSIVLEGSPFLFLSAVVSGLVAAFVPPSVWAGWMPRSRAGGIGAGILSGFCMPMCECGAVAVVRRMLSQGVPRTVALTYLLASPILNPFCILSTYYAFRAQNPWLMVGSRLGLGLILVIYLVWRLMRWRPEETLQAGILPNETTDDHHHDEHDSCCGHDHGHEHHHHEHEHEEHEHTHHDHHGHDHDHDDCGGAHSPESPRYLRFLHAVSEDFIGVLTFLVIGAAFAAVLNTSLPRVWLSGFGEHPVFGPILGVFLAQILCLCSTTDAFVIAAFPTFSFATKLAFLVAGPLFDFKLVWMYQVIFKRRMVFWLWFNITVGTLLLVYLWRPI